MGIKLQNRLVEARMNRGLTQKGLANLCGLRPSAISHFESGRRTPSIKNLVKLSKALCVSSDYLIGLSDGT